MRIVITRSAGLLLDSGFSRLLDSIRNEIPSIQNPDTACQYPEQFAEIPDDFPLMNRRAELKRLVQWAKSKGFPRPHRAYDYLLNVEERRLMRYVLRAPWRARFASVLYWISLPLQSTPRYSSKGSAQETLAGLKPTQWHNLEQAAEYLKNLRVLWEDASERE